MTFLRLAVLLLCCVSILSGAACRPSGSATSPNCPSSSIFPAKDAGKFNVLCGGGTLVVDTLFSTSDIDIFDENGTHLFGKSGLEPPNGRGYSTFFSGFGVPIHIRVTRRIGSAKLMPWGLVRGDVIEADFTVPVAERIPDDLLDDLRINGGGFRLKVRLHEEGVLIGWDIERRPGYDPRKRDQWGSAVYVAPVHSFAGGDFREAEIINGKAVRKGWYIHPKTGERIETDF